MGKKQFSFLEVTHGESDTYRIIGLADELYTFPDSDMEVLHLWGIEVDNSQNVKPVFFKLWFAPRGTVVLGTTPESIIMRALGGEVLSIPPPVPLDYFHLGGVGGSFTVACVDKDNYPPPRKVIVTIKARY